MGFEILRDAAEFVAFHAGNTEGHAEDGLAGPIGDDTSEDGGFK